MSFAELEGWLAALRAVRRPPGRFARRHGRGDSANDTTTETKTTRSISLRQPRPANKVKEDSHGT